MKTEQQHNLLTEEILEQRAREYSRQEEKIEIKGEIRQYLAFRLGMEWYVIDMVFVDEIIEVTNISRLPRQKDFVLGSMNVRGNILLVIDFGILLKLSSIDIKEQFRIVSVATAENKTGLCTDEVLGVISFDTGTLQPPISTIKGVELELIKGLFKRDEKHFVWLDIERILLETGNRLVSSY